jgi:hypothetical protein
MPGHTKQWLSEKFETLRLVNLCRAVAACPRNIIFNLSMGLFGYHEVNISPVSCIFLKKISDGFTWIHD